MTKRASTFTHYFGQPIGNGQDPDAPNDRSAHRTQDGMKLAGKGSVSGGSKPTPQAGRMRAGSAKAQTSYPRMTQRLRG